MAENQRDQQGQKNPQDQNQQRSQQQPQDKANPEVNPNEQREDEQQEGTKLPGKETRTPTAGQGTQDSGAQQKSQQGNTPTA